MTKRKVSLSKLLLPPPPPPIEERSGGSTTELALVPAAATRSHPFRLPRGWKIEGVPRSTYPYQIDKYYIEPGTRRKFRSLVSVERYIRGEDEVPFTKSKSLTLSHRRTSYRRMIISNGRMVKFNEEIIDQKQMALVPCGGHGSAEASPYNLPDGWVVEYAPRRDGRVDRYYYEPETGRRFRSHAAALRYLAESDETRPLSHSYEVLEENVPLSKMFKLEWHRKNSAPLKKKTRIYDTYKSSFLKPPEKVKWVIASTQGDIWNAFVGETLVPDPVKNQWSKRFMLFMNDGDGEEEQGVLEC
ncbi:hypothetical protein LIER_10526 [Lithospermum erythrorhizon]|uniref:MBD domain-containing protein n=1 Tax=Lithospermum erythrorhizon TaxID=34254 RepID=A0AAV3PMG0_LITER